MADTAHGNKGVISDIDIRIFLRDKDPSANLLLDDFEWTPEELRSAMTLAVDKWNDTPPPVVNYSIDNFPWRYALLIMTCANLLRMAGYRYQRNDLTYNVPGGAINDQNKAPAYFSAGDKLAQEFDEWMRLKKSEIQNSIGWGYV